ncbi:PEP-CTERM sorting domain-containing protein [Thalassotalea marina]|uniref:Ice-binding protein C-terminal domain-containing protein n=1 Tax=Thalassotalea marina TaxID=1673741 RepID=A0A919BHC6_9GAMM|nr:PEP-CTERM sorting domain-containing protein [Thalassotalea marina]GHF87626.1 hypothetical protein GCM10017161_14080 [Thalassotalea marina]
MKKLILPLLALGLSATANAGIITVYDNEADFLAATSISNSYNFDGDATSNFTDMDFGDFSITADGFDIETSISNSSSYFNSNHLDFYTECCNVPDTMKINFDFGISAFGFDFSNEDPTSDFTVITIDGNSYNVGTSGSAGFFGFTATGPISSVTFNDDAGNGGANTSTKYDNFIFTRADSVSVPEPTSIAILGLGVLGLALRRRKA